MGLFDGGTPEQVAKLKKQFYDSLAEERKALESKKEKGDQVCLVLIAFSLVVSGAVLVSNAFS